MSKSLIALLLVLCIWAAAPFVKFYVHYPWRPTGVYLTHTSCYHRDVSFDLCQTGLSLDYSLADDGYVTCPNRRIGFERREIFVKDFFWCQLPRLSLKRPFIGVFIPYWLMAALSAGIMARRRWSRRRRRIRGFEVQPAA